jgi:hypothetical protein
LGVLVTSTWWWRVPTLKKLDTPPLLMMQEFHFYHFGFFILLTGALLAWLLSGAWGLGRLTEGGVWLWLLFLAQLAIWGRVSFGEGTRNSLVAADESTEFIWVFLFILSLAAHPLPLKTLAGALILGGLIQGAVGLGQVWTQGDIGLRDWTGPALIRELPLDPARSGISVLGPERFLRPYGLAAHPNLWAPAALLAMMAGFTFYGPSRWGRIGALLIIGGGWYLLLLSFSRAALGGGMLALLVLLAWGLWRAYIRAGSARAGYIPPATIGLALILASVLFMLAYGDLWWGRAQGTAGATEAASFEDFSAASRAVYWEQAWQLIPDHLWRGVGRGNFAWESAYLLFCCDWRDLRGDHVHHIYLLALAEVGVVGFALWMSALTYGLGLALWRARGLGQIALTGALVGLLAIGFFDHYLWTQFGHQLLFWGVLACLLRAPVPQLADSLPSAAPDLRLGSAPPHTYPSPAPPH